MKKRSEIDWVRQELEALQATEGYIVPAGNGASSGLKEALAPLKHDANEHHFVPLARLEKIARDVRDEEGEERSC